MIPEFDLFKVAQRAARLSQRHRQVLIGIAEGKTQKEIAADLGLSPDTIKNHADVLYRRLGVGCIAHATRAAVAAKLVQ